ncbi:penicillin acylase family protein [Phycicoccus ginsengisoli]
MGAGTAALVVVALGTPAQAAGPDGYGSLWNILPPGQSGTVTAADLVKVTAGDPDRVAVDGRNAPPGFADQLEMYDALNRRDPASITTADIGSYYKRESFTPDTVVRSATPKPGVSIRWDSHGVPYIKGATRDDTMWGAGYAGTKDRMFLMDVLRHAGRARLAEFAGATPGNLEMDREQLRSAFYTEQEAAAQVANLPQRYGAEGRRLAAGADAFIAGINAAQDQLCPGGLPTGPSCPAEYAALGKTPQPWTRADVTYVASLVGGIFGKGGGSEYQNAIWLQQLQSRFGADEGRRIYTDLREKDNAGAPTTAETTFPYGGGAVDESRPGVALPDVHGAQAPGTGAPLDGTTLPGGTTPLLPGGPAHDLGMDTPLGRIDVPIVSHGMSNALVVGAQHSTTGHPVTVFGPQTGYYTPQLLTEEVLDGPGLHARGVSFAATNLVVQLGRGVDYAWSATSASNDLVDTVAERLCNTDGSPATVGSTAYVRDGRCVPLERYDHSYLGLPSAGSTTAPKRYSYLVLRSDHGIVQLRTTVRGVPVAIVTQRSTYHHEVDSLAGFARFNDPGVVHDAASFTAAAGAIDYTFNWFYTDDRDIAYFSSGRLPVRAAGTDFDLPRWGDARYDWSGWLPAAAHPQQVDPARGYFVSWNNKPAPGWSAADNVWGYGTVYRSLALEDRVRAAVAGGRKVDIGRLTGIVADAATVDSRAAYTLPYLLRTIGDDPATARARQLLQAWLDDGAHRVDRARTGHYAHEQAIRIFDEWWESGGNAVAKDVLGGRLGQTLTDELPQPVDDHPRQGLGSSWNGIAWYGYVNQDLRQLAGESLPTPHHVVYCGDGVLEACRATLRTSLADAVDRALAAEKVATVDELTYDKTQDDIRSTTAGVVGVRPIDWQNRPTFQQVVAFTGHRPR